MNHAKNGTELLLKWALCLVLLVGAGLAGQARAQLSPGPLSAPHAHLEGLTRCSSCHKLGSREVQDKCLACHQEIATMRSSGRGLHAGEDYQDCVDCHVEHHGRDFDLVFWPDGREGFDHGVTGFALQQSHARLQCRQCHAARYQTDPAFLREKQKDPTRTFLGLSATCTACHEDVHAGQFTAQCTACHDAGAWKPAPRFDHGATVFPLTGKHQQVACAGCHKAESGAAADGAAGAAAPVTRFKPVEHGSCASCHRDPHAGSLGGDCARCHETGDWKRIAGEGFDHDRTRYPLRGRHAALRCNQCHRTDGGKPEFATCTACHGDEHEGARRGRPALAACQECHTVQGFRPARYTLEQHQQGAFPLRGAHRAVPCLACHQPTEAGRTQLLPPHGTCGACHRDPHPAGMAGFAGGQGGRCDACHGAEGWTGAAFDHGQTGFALDGAHARARCRDCHKNEAITDFRGLQTACAGCHEDIHAGQFTARRTGDGGHVACDECHVTRDWFAEKFDHERDSRFALRGGHETTPCARCHLPRQVEGRMVVNYRPVPTACKDCHSTPPAGGKNGAKP